GGDSLPKLVVVGLEYHPLGPAIERRCDVVEVASHVDVLELGVRTRQARTPHPVSTPTEGAQHVDAFGVEHLLLTHGDCGLETQRARDDLICRCLVNSALRVVAGVYARHVPGRRYRDFEWSAAIAG